MKTLADEVTESSQGFHLGGGDYVMELLAPEGHLPAQQLCLKPRRPGFTEVIVGTVNPIQKFAELRSYEHVFLVQQVRFRKPLEITQPEWERLLRRCEVVLQRADIESARVGPSPDLLRESRNTKSGRRVSPTALAVFCIVVVLAAVVTALVVRKLLAGS